MSLYPRVELNDIQERYSRAVPSCPPMSSNTAMHNHKTNLDRLVHTEGVTLKEVNDLKKKFSGIASKEIRKKVIDILYKIEKSEEYVKENIKPPTMRSSVFMIAIKRARHVIFNRLDIDEIHYNDDCNTIADQNTLKVAQKYEDILNGFEFWQNE